MEKVIHANTFRMKCVKLANKIKGLRKSMRISGRTRRNWFYAYAFLMPWLIGVFLLLIYPLYTSFSFSRSQVRFPPTGLVQFPVGWENYTNIFALDTVFMTGLVSFTLQLIPQMAIIVSFALIISMLLNGRIKARGLFRAVFFLPVIIATGPVMSELINEGVATVPAVNLSAIANAMDFLPPMVLEPIVGLFTQLIMILWNSGVQILIFLAALQKINPEQYEAAKMDGASGWECFWKITSPALRPMLFLNVIYTVVWLANSDQNPIINMLHIRMIAGVLGPGGMPGGYGHASAMAWVYSIVVLLIIGLCWVVLHERKDKDKPETKRLEQKSYLPKRREIVRKLRKSDMEGIGVDKR